MEISQRAATVEDLEWLDPFYESIMRPFYVKLNCVWDRDKFRNSFDPNITTIIQADKIDIGMLKTDRC